MKNSFTRYERAYAHLFSFMGSWFGICCEHALKFRLSFLFSLTHKLSPAVSDHQVKHRGAREMFKIFTRISHTCGAFFRNELYSIGSGLCTTLIGSWSFFSDVCITFQYITFWLIISNGTMCFWLNFVLTHWRLKRKCVDALSDLLPLKPYVKIFIRTGRCDFE